MTSPGFSRTRTAAPEPAASAGLAHSHGFLPSRRPAPVLSNRELASGIFCLTISDPYIAANTRAGQFANLYTHDSQRLFPRPFGIGYVEGEAVSFIFAVRGEGTRQLSSLSEGESVFVLGPLGTPFPLEEGHSYLLVGGGLGVPPLIKAAQDINHLSGAQAVALFGYRNIHFADAIMGKYTKNVYSIDDADGNVLTLLDRYHQVQGQVQNQAQILACGPEVMMRAVAHWGAEHSVPVRLSLEERMGCGYGSCFSCVTPTVAGYKKVCLDGPSFTADYLGWE